MTHQRVADDCSPPCSAIISFVFLLEPSRMQMTRRLDPYTGNGRRQRRQEHPQQLQLLSLRKIVYLSLIIKDLSNCFKRLIQSSWAKSKAIYHDRWPPNQTIV
jgi:hypothetical protein